MAGDQSKDLDGYGLDRKIRTRKPITAEPISEVQKALTKVVEGTSQVQTYEVFATRPSTRSPLASQPEAARSFLLGGAAKSALSLLRRRGNADTRRKEISMLAKFMKWISISLLVLAVLWPSPAGYQILVAAFVVCAGSLLAARTSRAGSTFGRPDTRRFHAR
jgi:hypothetical protein